MVLNVNMTLIKARSLVKRGDVKAAAQLYTSIINQYPKNNEAIKSLAVLNKSAAVANKTPSRSPSQGQMDFLFNLYAQGKLREALKQGTALVSQYPESSQTYNILGVVNMALGQFKDAVANYSKAIQLNPDYANAHNNLGAALKTLGRHEEAVTSYTKALRFQPDYAAAHSNLGVSLKALGRIEDAIASFTHAIKLKPDFADAHNNLGNALKSLDRIDESIASYTKAIQFKPDYSDAYNNLGIALLELGEHDEAIACYHKALQFKPDCVVAFSHLAEFYEKRNDLDNLSKTLKAAQTAKVGSNGTLLLYSAQLEYRNKRYQEALIALESINTQLLDNKARTFYFNISGKTNDILGHYDAAYQ